jgi:hypothetical protein
VRGKRRIRIPNKLRIAGKIWRVRFRDDLQKTEKVVGQCLYAPRIIEIDSTLPRSEQEMTFVHELLHAIFPRTACSSRLEEKVVFAMEEKLYKLVLSGQLGTEAT